MTPPERHLWGNTTQMGCRFTEEDSHERRDDSPAE